ncbi:MAG: MaoC family dehydratase N-terminal domain-containing protein [Comamonas sp.]|uniref:FAS1-like dehydratase domain-containing protein n=1 Tax=Comamonas sp. TaxID=34028 RepID=UPI002649DF98|nr:MaoC family dehydratase N-terminal domain-containing protein [Comamonas sp.]MDN5505306.1 MaoC family dehydratase N-terminal domain-containing protein [Comamonas sp.]MDN5536990.1 MaoC family dehydratase N-terminal domain-containing protein [Comamonas sp.]
MNPNTVQIDVAALTKLQSWQERSETMSDIITAAPLRALSATLDRDDPAPEEGSAVPALWHWLYFLPHARQSEIGPDGHARRGGFLPPVPLPRRMWAGGRLRWEAGNPLRVGQQVQRVSTIRSVQHKTGRSGELLFVLVEHRFSNQDGLALTEEHDIVYRAAARPGDPEPPPQQPPLADQAAWSRTIVPDDILLFRYSALTFNGHRIHYDRRYVTQVEGYPGLIVHGPLIATLLLDLLRRQLPGARVVAFDFKALRPTFDLHPFNVHGKPREDGRTIDLWAQDHEGLLTMQATATVA